MKKLARTALVFGVLTLFCLASSKGAAAASDWSLKIAADSHGKALTSLRQFGTFFVILTNQAYHDLSLNCYQDREIQYESLSFTFKGKRDEKVSVTTGPINETWRLCGTKSFRPGQSYIIEVDLSSKKWVGARPPLGPTTMTACYENEIGIFQHKGPTEISSTPIPVTLVPLMHHQP